MVNTGRLIGDARFRPQRPYGRAVKTHSVQPAQRVNPLPAMLALVGVLLPSEAQLFIGGAKFTPGRAAEIVLLLPAIFMLFGKGRRLLLCDLFAVAIAAWMAMAAIYVEGPGMLVRAAGGDILDFFGGYLVARGFFYGLPAVDTFVRILKYAAIVAVAFAIADTLSGRYLIHETISHLVGATSWPVVGFRKGWIRATSTFDHAILFGTFCAFVAIILLNAEKSWFGRVVFVSICILGIVLSWSSSALLAFLIGLGAYVFDRTMKHISARWTILWTGVGAAIVIAYLASNNLLSWLISHLTLDPQTGYYRIMIWNAANWYISNAPVFGYGYQMVNNDILDWSVDSVWLVAALRFGLPLVVFLFLANLAAFSPVKNQDPRLHRLSHAFTVVLLLFMFAGLTVHFWNFMWMFWGVCLGVRASLRELSLKMARQPRGEPGQIPLYVSFSSPRAR